MYNYRKEGATPVPNQAAADEAIRAAQAAVEAIHGLGFGGNKPHIEGGQSTLTTMTDVKAALCFQITNLTQHIRTAC